MVADGRGSPDKGRPPCNRSRMSVKRMGPRTAHLIVASSAITMASCGTLPGRPAYRSCHSPSCAAAGGDGHGGGLEATVSGVRCVIFRRLMRHATHAAISVPARHIAGLPVVG